MVKIRGTWRQVERVNPNTVTAIHIDGPCKGWKGKYPYAEIKEARP